MAGLLDIDMGTPEGQGFNNALLGMAQALLTPQARGGGMGAAFAAFPAAMDRAKQQAMREQLMALQQKQVGLEGDKLGFQMDEIKRKAEAERIAKQNLATFLSQFQANGGKVTPDMVSLGVSSGLKVDDLSKLAGSQNWGRTKLENVNGVGVDPYTWKPSAAIPDPNKPFNNAIGPDGRLNVTGNPALQNYEIGKAREGATRVDIIPGKNDPNWGEPPKDMVWARDQGGNIIVQRDPSSGAFAPLALPVAGSKTGQEIDSAARQKQAAIATAADSIAVLDKAINHPGRSTASGLSGYLDPRNYIAGTDARNFQTLLAQIKGKAFLQAFETLKGGGQITEVEGKKATDAIARLDTTQSDEEFKSALEELRGIMAKGYERLAQKSYSPTQNKDPLGVRAGKSSVDDPLGIR